MKKKQLKPEPYMMNRELSWLKFNERVLNEAGNPRVPLAERLTFASIYQSNLDEFYMVRVGTLMDQMESSEVVRENKTNMTSKEQVKAIIDATRELDIKKAVIYEQLMGELEPQGIRIINFNKLSGKEGELLETYFDNEIAPYLSANIISKQQPFPFLQNKEIYAVALLATKGGKTKTAIIPCSNNVFKRLIDIPTRPGTFMLSEELILHFLPNAFKGYNVQEKSVLRVTRNADIDVTKVYDEDLNYRDQMAQVVKLRKKLAPVRLELTRDIAQRFNSIYGDVFTVPEAYIGKVGAKIMSLQEPSRKMSKSDENPNGSIYLMDDPDTIMRKFKRAVTDSEGQIRYRDEQPGIKNLISIYCACTGKTPEEVEREFDGRGYGEFKPAVGEAVISVLKPLQARVAELTRDKAYIDSVIKNNAEKADYVANKTLRKVQKKVGFPDKIR